MKTIQEDTQEFYKMGGWTFLTGDGSDEEDSESSAESEFAASDVDQSESDGFSDSDGEYGEAVGGKSWIANLTTVRSDEDDFDDDASDDEDFSGEEDEDEGLDWDELENKAKRGGCCAFSLFVAKVD